MIICTKYRVTYLKFFILCQKIINILLQQIHEYFEKKNIQMSIVVWIFVWISSIMMLWQSVFSINYTFLFSLIIKCKQYNNKISTKKIWQNHYTRIISSSETCLKKNLSKFLLISNRSNLSKFLNIYTSHETSRACLITLSLQELVTFR